MRNVSNNIEPKGIVRNTSILTSQDGEMEEFTNLVHKDGTIQTARKCEVLDVDIKDYTDIFVHSSVYRNMIGKLNGGLYWFAKAEKGETEYTNITGVKICDCDGDFSHVQTGNLLTIVNDSNMYHILFDTKTGSYRSALQAGFNGEENTQLLPPNDLIEFKTEGEVDSKGRYKYVANETVYTDTASTLEELKTELGAVLEETISKCKEENLFNEGYFLVCTAYKLYDGSYVLNSRPLLMSPCGVSNFINNNYNTADLEKSKYDISSIAVDNKISFDVSARDKKNYTSVNIYRQETHLASPVVFNKKEPIKDNDYTKVNVYSNVNIGSYDIDGDIIKENTNHYNSLNEIAPLNLIRQSDKCLCTMPVQKLKYKIKKDIDSSYEDIIEEVCVFISKPIREYNTENYDLFSIENDSASWLFNNTTVTPYHYEVGSGDRGGIKWRDGVVTNIHPAYHTITAFPEHKEIDDIKEEIGKIDTFYEVLSIPFNEIKKSNDWVEVDPEDGVMTNLTAQQKLTEDTYSRTSIFPEVAYSYNGRLHLANYKTSLFDGFPLNYFQYWGGYGQQDVTRRLISNKIANGNTLQWYIKTTIESDEGNVEVMRYYKSQLGGYMNNLNPFLSYPDARATQMEVGVNFNNTTYSLKTFKLEAHKFLDLAYYIGDNIDSIDLDTSSGFALSLPEIDRTKYSAQPNVIRVSMTESPMVFPASNTYQIGNAKILGFASNSKDLSTGQVGSAPLYVFSGDGIFALFVDSSGSMAYTNSRPLAMDVVNNEKSITIVDGGILFSTDRGLMVLSGSQVQDISESIEGNYIESLESDADEYLSECAIIENNDKVVQLGSLFTSETFKDYLADSVIAYEYNEREIWIANPNKEYIYVFKNGLWSKRSISVTQFINDYPRTYVKTNGLLLKMGEPSDSSIDTTFITRPITFNSTDFKQSNSVVLRGNFELDSELNTRDVNLLVYSDLKVINVVLPDYETVSRPSFVEEDKQVIDGPDELTEIDYSFAAETGIKPMVVIPSVYDNDISFDSSSFNATLNTWVSEAIIEVSPTSSKIAELANNTYANAGDKTTLQNDISLLISNSDDFPDSVKSTIISNGVFLKFIFLKQWSVHVVMELVLSNSDDVTVECDLITSPKDGVMSSNYTPTNIPSADVTSVSVTSVTVEEIDAPYELSSDSIYDKYYGSCYVLYDLDNYLQNTSELLVMYQHFALNYDGTASPEETNLSFVNTVNSYKRDSVDVITADKFLSQNIIIKYNPIYTVPFDTEARLVLTAGTLGYDFTSRSQTEDDTESYLELTGDEIVAYINDGTFVEDIKIRIVDSQRLNLTINLSIDGVFTSNSYNIDSTTILLSTTHKTFERAYSLGAIPLAITSGDDVLITLTKGNYYYFEDVQGVGEAYKYVKINTTETLSYADAVNNVESISYEIGSNKWNKVITLPIGENVNVVCVTDNFDVKILYFYYDDPRVTELSDTQQSIIYSDFVDMFNEGVFTDDVNYDDDARIVLYPPENINVTMLDGTVKSILYKSNSEYDYTALEVMTAKELNDLIIAHPEYFGEQVTSYDRYAGLYIYGSYDAKVWHYLGGNEKKGIFRDMGCVTSRTDCKFFKVVFAGHLSKDSRIDFLEWSAKTKLDRKSR